MMQHRLLPELHSNRWTPEEQQNGNAAAFEQPFRNLRNGLVHDEGLVFIALLGVAAIVVTILYVFQRLVLTDEETMRMPSIVRAVSCQSRLARNIKYLKLSIVRSLLVILEEELCFCLLGGGAFC
jgi:hypothetical protein